ncbi:S8 family serine peptidase [Mesorhizobium hawassense]|uniref:S8 family serine peptidase n=1 Tax=Mesorhizobium hawassense TaxID=1209954 RepID=UPI001FE06CE0|nr:S8 family serine peptidase [Mesorhizobium hawassense]
MAATSAGGTLSGTRQLVFRAGDDFSTVVTTSCFGAADTKYIDRVIQYLAQFGRSMDAHHTFDRIETLTIPICPEPAAPGDTIVVTVSEKPRRNLWYYFLLLTEDKKISTAWNFEYHSEDGPREWPNDRSSRYFVDVFRALNPGQDPTALTPGEIVLPVRPNEHTLDLPASNIDTLEPIFGLQSAPNDGSCDQNQEALSYPYDLKGVLEALDGRELSSPARVVIVDSGLYTAQKGESIFADNLFFDRANFSDADRKRRTLEVMPLLPTEAEAVHGTQVASVALGGPLFARAHNLAASPRWIRIDPYNIDESRAGKARARADRFLAIFDSIQAHGTTIVNLSLRTDRPINTIEHFLDNVDSPFLFVVAAGNGGQELKQDAAVPSFPAIYGGSDSKGRSKLITVAALARSADGVWALASFSDFSPRHVEIGAPGCRVPVETYLRSEEAWSNRVEFANGTSFASPLVAFAAALLSASNDQLTPELLKARLMASADLQPQLTSSIADGRVLNVVKAVASNVDIVQTASGTFAGSATFVKTADGGPLADEAALVTGCVNDPEKPPSPNTVWKIVPNFGKEPFPDKVYIYNNNTKTIVSIDCKLSDGVKLVFKPRGATGTLQLGWGSIVDFVPRIR